MAEPISIPHSKSPVPPPLPPPKHLDEYINRSDEMVWRRDMVDAAALAHKAARTLSGSPPTTMDLDSLHNDYDEEEREREGSQHSGKYDDRRSSQGESVDEGYSSLSVTSGPSLPKLIPREPVKVESRQSMNLYDSSVLRKFTAIGPESGYNSINKVLSSPREDGSNSLDSQDSPRRSSGVKAIQTQNLSSSISISGSPLTDSPISKYPPMSLSANGQRQGLLSAAHADERKALAARDGVEMASQDEQSRLATRSNRTYPSIDIDSSMQESGLSLLSLRSQSPKPTEAPYPRNDRKRRASSPPIDDAILHPQHASQGGSPRRLHPNGAAAAAAAASSLSSYSSSAPRSSSYNSSSGYPAASSISSISSSYDQLSPGSGDIDMNGPISPYRAIPSPRGGYAAPPTHYRTLSDSTMTPHDPQMLEEAPMPERKLARGVQRNYNTIMCECCPKKPKKFDSIEELKQHEAEKQFKCLYCHNRFKNKNEAERHQNSLHLRKHSWSCAALSSPEAAFPTSWQKGSVADVCGYCGEEFAVPADWQARMEHLSNVHKYNECNQQKKFFRADHFRQHLKHSHAGTSGKWTNMLEDACMRDEPLPEPIAEERG